MRQRNVFKVFGLILAIGVAAVFLMVVGGIIGYKLGNDGDGTVFKLDEAVSVDMDGHGTGYLPPGVVLYGVRDRFAEKTSRYKLYLVSYEAHPVKLTPVGKKEGREFWIHVPEGNRIQSISK